MGSLRFYFSRSLSLRLANGCRRWTFRSQNGGSLQTLRIRRPGWIPNPGHFEGITTQRVDFPVWPNIEERPRSTRRAQWAGSKPKHGLPAPPGRFSSSTTTAEFFQPWALPPRPPPPTRIPLHTESPLSSTTTYTTSYPVHELPARPGGPLPEPRLPVTKFTETSTQRADYIAPPAMEREVGRGEPLYVSNRETRDFVTTTKENHGTKEAVKCTVLGYVGWDKERRPDGHVYAVGERRSKEAQLR
ncbi:hypothetical protein BJ742DRAFT_870077 [Cladochytrium replicatum]|nr:hypothetical protein BJ742DRAFT_870077 [Cladochytrium replicatum]